MSDYDRFCGSKDRILLITRNLGWKKKGGERTGHPSASFLSRFGWIYYFKVVISPSSLHVDDIYGNRLDNSPPGFHPVFLLATHIAQLPQSPQKMTCGVWYGVVCGGEKRGRGILSSHF